MTKTILITGSTDGIGLETAKILVQQGHKVLIHGRSEAKLEKAQATLAALGGEPVAAYLADLSQFDAVSRLAQEIQQGHDQLDVLINNAGIYRTSKPITQDQLDVRFVVNTLAPYLLTQRLLPLLGSAGRVINLSSAAQAPVDLDAMKGSFHLSEGAAYAQSKLAITIWTRELATRLRAQGPVFIAVNPGSLLASKMVKEAFGVAGSDLQIGADILCRAALDEVFADKSGQYFDNDSRRFADPHPEAFNVQKSQQLLATMEDLLNQFT